MNEIERGEAKELAYRERQQRNNPIFKDKEALKAIRLLKSKGYSAEDVIQKLWEMERGI